MFGLVLLGIDWSEGLPSWWTAWEGPFVTVFGLALVTLARRLPDEALILMVGHLTGEARRIPWMALTRAVDNEDWGRDLRDGRLGGLP